jgi:hypothetical protein
LSKPALPELRCGLSIPEFEPGHEPPVHPWLERL